MVSACGSWSMRTIRHGSRDPDHPILARPWEYNIAELRYVAETSDEEGFIEITLSKGTEVRRLRFASPRGLSVDEGFHPANYIGLQIIDASGRQMEGIGVEVSTFENAPGCDSSRGRWKPSKVTIDRDRNGAS